MERADPSVLLNAQSAMHLASVALPDAGPPFSVYLPALLEQWIPELEGVQRMLQEGALGAAIGFGCGAAAMALARAYPSSHFFGFDPDPTVVRRAQQRAEQEGLSERTTFEQAVPEGIPNHRYALILLLSGLVESGDPMGVAWRALTTLDPAGSLVVVEPRAIPVDRRCVSSPGSALAQAGFRHARLIDQTAFARVFEARR